MREVYGDVRVTWQVTRKTNHIQRHSSQSFPCYCVDAVIKMKVIYKIRLNCSNRHFPVVSEGSPEPRPKTLSADLRAPPRGSSPEPSRS